MFLARLLTVSKSENWSLTINWSESLVADYQLLQLLGDRITCSESSHVSFVFFEMQLQAVWLSFNWGHLQGPHYNEREIQKRDATYDSSNDHFCLED